ncbi:metallophosphoesterase [Candidatus Nitrosopelagicus sp.]|nr:metallophosphoesterase [Candidatus Nitrosopelagicus sp.]
MKIGIISDTHDDVDNTNKAIDIFKENDVKAVIHAGDIISPPIIKEFKRLTEIGVEFFGVFGNNDGERNGLKEAFEWIGGKLLGDVGKIEIDGLKFGIYHGHEVKKTKKMMNSGKFDVFVYGHSHLKDPDNNIVKKIGKTIIINPGSAHKVSKTFYTVPYYFRESSILILDTQTLEINFIEL